MSMLINRDGYVTKNFKLSELNASGYARSRRIKNVATGYTAENQQWLAIVLQLIRDHFGVPMVITSGFRSDVVNKGVGGSPTSAHRHGSAADVKFSNVANNLNAQREMAIKIAQFLDEIGIVYDQLIYYKSWVHVGMRFRSNGRKQIFAG